MGKKLAGFPTSGTIGVSADLIVLGVQVQVIAP
jgi:hypothetical protein